MKKSFAVVLLTLCGSVSFAQVSINPYNIQLHDTIELHGKIDAYYHPFAPPASTDTREQLSCEALFFRDSDALAIPWSAGNPYQPYAPMTHSVLLQNWTPPGDAAPLGVYAVWQRLFQSLPLADGTPTDIIAGGLPGDTVTISANEDVDFRASGTVKLEDGFHADTGSFFHAYQEPAWDTAVFSDEFDDTIKFDSLWHISNGTEGNYYPMGPEAMSVSNVFLDTDYQAHDGHALDIIMRLDTVHRFLASVLHDVSDCGNSPDLSDTLPDTLQISSGMIRSCPFPYKQKVDTPFRSWYAHTPYGKYEIREKIPHIYHHTNNWGGGFGYGFEWDLNETDWNTNGTINPDWNHSLRYGPYSGHFSRLPDSTVIFTSSQAEWCLSNHPNAVIVNDVAYPIDFISGHGFDTVGAANETTRFGWPPSVVNDTSSVQFYYSKNGSQQADKLPWKVSLDTVTHRWDIFRAGFHVRSPGDTLFFSKTNQPVAITLTIDTAFGSHVTKTIPCHWEYNLNHSGDTSVLMLDIAPNDSDSVKTMTWSDLHSGDEAYTFQTTDLYSDAGYPVSPLPFDGTDTTPSSYRYHTFAMEFLPHEVRILIDSIVVRRFPDRLVPPGNPYSDFVTTMPRIPIDIRPSETDFDPLVYNAYGGGVPIRNEERWYFEHAASIPGWPGFEDTQIPPGTGPFYHVAHHEIDYIKVWDVPKDVIIPNLPY